MTSILEEALRTVDGDREQTHGDPGANLRRIAAKWSVTFGVPVTPHQVALAMIDLKTVRLIDHPEHRDSWVDIAGYGRLAERAGCIGVPVEPEAEESRLRALVRERPEDFPILTTVLGAPPGERF